MYECLHLVSNLIPLHSLRHDAQCLVHCEEIWYVGILLIHITTGTQIVTYIHYLDLKTSTYL